MLGSSVSFGRIIRGRRSRFAVPLGVLFLCVAATAWAIAGRRMSTGSNHAETADVSQSKLSADRLEQPAETSHAPGIELSTHRLDLGDGKPNEELRGTLVLSNRSAAPLDFWLTTTCGCSKPNPQNGTLGVGAEQAIELSVKLEDHAQSEKSPTVTVSYKPAGAPEDAAPEVATCRLLARCPAPFAVSQAFLDFGSVLRKELPTAARALRITSVAGQQPVSLGSLEVERAQEFYQIAICTDDAGADDAGAVLLRLSLPADLPLGDYSDTLELRLAESEYVVRVPLHVKVVGPVTVVPATLFLRKDASTGRFRPATAVVMCRSPVRGVGALRLVAGPTGVVFEDAGALGGGGRRIRMGAADDLAPLESLVRFAADGVDEELSFMLVVKP